MTDQSAEHYDKMRNGTEGPDDPKPESLTALRARKRAIREGRLVAPARDELAAIAQAEATAEVQAEEDAQEAPDEEGDAIAAEEAAEEAAQDAAVLAEQDAQDASAEADLLNG